MRSLLSPLCLTTMLCVACSGSSPSQTGPAHPSTEGPTPPSSLAEISPAPTPPALPSAKVTQVKDVAEKESAGDRRVQIVFENPTTQPCRFTSYKLVWGSSSKPGHPDDLIVPPKETRMRWLRLHPSDGDIGSVSDTSARVEVETTCGTDSAK